jgi:hypothetical protein
LNIENIYQKKKETSLQEGKERRKKERGRKSYEKKEGSWEESLRHVLVIQYFSLGIFQVTRW